MIQGVRFLSPDTIARPHGPNSFNMAASYQMPPALQQIEAFLNGAAERSSEWPTDPGTFSEFIIELLQVWFKETPAGESYLCASFIPKCAEYLLTHTDGERDAPMILGSRFVGDPKNSVALIARAAGCFDWVSVMAAKIAVKPDQHIYDIGANIGTETIPFAKLVPDGRVTAVEPEPRNAAWLERNLGLNNLTNVTSLCAAASDHPEKLQPQGYVPYNTGIVHVTQSETEGTQAVTLDQIYEQNDRAPVSYVHIDVEGFETKVLRGAEKLITDCSPLIYIEAQQMWLSRAGTSVQELYQTFQDHRYRVYRVSRGDGTLPELAEENLDSVEDENWLAIPQNDTGASRILEFAETFRELNWNPDAFNEYFSFPG